VINMSKQKVATIVQRLHGATISGKVDWELTEKEGVYQASYPDFSIRISTQPAIEPEPEVFIDYVLSIYNNKGTLLESVTDVELQGEVTTPFKTLGEIYESARGYALGLEQTLDSIINSLPEEFPF